MPRRSALLAALALAAFPAAAHAAPVQVAHAGWTWGNPLPQGDSLSSLALQGNRGYAVGEFGTMLRTDDGGATWTGVPTGLTEDLDTVRMISPDSVVIAGGCPVRRSDDGGKTFRRLPWTASDERCTAGVAALAFPTPAVGYLLLHNGNVLRSSDSGRTWARRTAIPGTPATSAASRVDPTDLVLTSEQVGFASTSGGNLFRTEDGGSTWTPAVDEPWAIRTVTFPTPDIGYASGDAAAVLRTTDGGRTWAEQALPADAGGLASVRCAGPATCMGVTRQGDRLVRTADGGATWASLAPSTQALRAVAPISPSQAVAVGEGGVTVVSGDGGRTFSEIGATLPPGLTGLSAIGPRTAVAYGHGGALARTLDG